MKNLVITFIVIILSIAYSIGQKNIKISGKIYQANSRNEIVLALVQISLIQNGNVIDIKESNENGYYEFLVSKNNTLDHIYLEAKSYGYITTQILHDSNNDAHNFQLHLNPTYKNKKDTVYIKGIDPNTIHLQTQIDNLKADTLNKRKEIDQLQENLNTLQSKNKLNEKEIQEKIFLEQELTHLKKENDFNKQRLFLTNEALKHQKDYSAFIKAQLEIAKEELKKREQLESLANNLYLNYFDIYPASNKNRFFNKKLPKKAKKWDDWNKTIIELEIVNIHGYDINYELELFIEIINLSTGKNLYFGSNHENTQLALYYKSGKLLHTFDNNSSRLNSTGNQNYLCRVYIHKNGIMRELDKKRISFQK